MVGEWSLSEDVEGAPLWTFLCSIVSQFIIFPIVGHCCSAKTYNFVFTALLVKDFFVCDLSKPLVAHHILSIFLVHKFCHRKSDMLMCTIGELGSAFFNVATLSRHYNILVDPVYVLYAIIISLSNLYVLQHVFQYRTTLFWKLMPSLVVLGRQSFVYV